MADGHTTVNPYLCGESAEEERIREKYARRVPDDSRYSWFSPGHVFMVQERERRFLQLLKRNGVHSLADKQILEIGCGRGDWLRALIQWGAKPENLKGVDLLPDRVDDARRLCPTEVQVTCGSAGKLEFPSAAFDLVFQSTVFTSIQDDGLKRQVAAEMMRVVRPGGLILWYDFRVSNPRNPDVSGIGKKEILGLFPRSRIKLISLTPPPPLVRILAPWSWLVCYFLGKVPWLRTHYMGVIRSS